MYIHYILRLQAAYKLKKAPNYTVKSDETISELPATAVSPVVITCQDNLHNQNDGVISGLLHKLVDTKSGKRKSLKRIPQADLLLLCKHFDLPTKTKDGKQDLKCLVLRENLEELSTEIIMEQLMKVSYNENDSDHNSVTTGDMIL